MIVATANEIRNGLSKLDILLKYEQSFPVNNKFYYEYYSVTEDVLTIDVTSFNANFLKMINRTINSSIVGEFVAMLLSSDKQSRVVKYGLLFRELTKLGVNINPYMIGFRNYVMENFLKLYSYSSKNVNLYRINYDDIEFSTLNNDEYNISEFVRESCIDIVKMTKVDYVVTLNKRDGVFYVNNGRIVNIKYTSGWVNIPIYTLLLNEVVNFIISKETKLSELNDKMREVVEYSSNDIFFGYEDDELSKKYSPNDTVPMGIKNLFISKTISKFVMLFNRL